MFKLNLEKAKEPESAGVGSSLKIYMLNKHPGVILEHPEVWEAAPQDTL